MQIPNIRTGIGYDVHQITSGRKLILCGVEIPCTFGLSGHSDADVITHALMDSLLGAAGLFDIGYYFPPNDQNFKDISSLKLLTRVKKLLLDNNYQVGNVDMILISEKPKISPYIIDMKKNLSEILQIETTRIGIKATTNEKMGFVGRLEGMAALATSLIYKN